MRRGILFRSVIVLGLFACFCVQARPGGAKGPSAPTAEELLRPDLEKKRSCGSAHRSGYDPADPGSEQGLYARILQGNRL